MSGTSDYTYVPTGASVFVSTASALSQQDPVASAQPTFAYSLLVQVMMNGILLTLSVALIGLLGFSARYHWPLAKYNFALQCSALITFLVIMITNTVYILTASKERSHEWPYMFDYVEFLIPPHSWTKAQHVVTYTFIGLIALLCHASHIQFLTLIFPSSLERKLILILLTPIALASSVLVYLSLHPDPHIQDLGDAIRAVCNSSLTLLYTTALFIWGVCINRSRAWRWEGSTASFGGLAILFGVTGSILNYIEIKEDRLVWLQNSVWCILLWQSWLSFWWWVSAGMYAGEVADRDVREAQKAKRRQKRRARRRRQEAGTALPAVALSASGTESLSARLAQRMGMRRAVAEVPEAEDASNALSRAGSSNSFARLTEDGTSVAPRRRREQRRHANAEGIEMQDLSTGERQSETSSSDVASSWRTFLPWPRFMTRLMVKLQKAHDRATRSKALELPLTNDPPGPFGRVFIAPLEDSVLHSESAERRSDPADGPYQEIGAGGNASTSYPPGRDLRGAGMPRNGWQWKGGIRKARLRAVDTF